MRASPEGSYILLPARGLTAVRPIEEDFLTRFRGITSTGPAAMLSANDFFAPVASRAEESVGVPLRNMGDVEVVDSVHEYGPKLVRMSEAAAAAYELSGVGQAVPIRYYEPATSPSAEPHRTPSSAATNPPVRLIVRRGADHAPVPAVKVIVYTSLDAGEGAAAVTNDAGEAVLQLGPSPIAADTLYIEAPAAGMWGKFQRGIIIQDGQVIELEAVQENFDDCLRRHCAPFAATDGQGVKVAIVDTGVGPHPDLVLSGGSNTVTGEDRDLLSDNGVGHGTHVAGIIGGRRGIAPAAQLWVGRAYPQDEARASNYSIMKAIMLAGFNQCHVVNLSLAGSETDAAIQSAVQSASEDGAVIIAAAGNDGAPQVSFPARSPYASGVSAFGVAGCCPVDSAQAAEIGDPSKDDIFFAAFSNHGPEIRLIGPGVGVVSYAIGGGYSVRSGTSMACAAVSGMTARILSATPAVRDMPASYDRSAAIQNLLVSRARALGLGLGYEGAGAI